MLSFVLMGLLSSVHAATLSQAKGTVEVKRSGAALWTQAKSKDGVKPGDVLRTGAGSSAELSTAEGHRLQLREKTTARIDATDNGDSRFFLEVGKVRSRVAKLRGSQKFEIRTPLAVASVRGTVFDMEVGENQVSKLFVVEGAVGYKELSGLSQEVLVPAGQGLTFTPPAPPSGDKSSNNGSSKGDKSKEEGRDPKKDPADSDQEKKEGEEGKEGGKSKDLDKSEKEKERDAARRAQKLEKILKEKGYEKEEKEEKKESNSRDVLKSDLLKEDLKREILRETEISLEKDFTQSDVVQDLKQEQAQDGKTMIDRLGRRVRFEEYLTRGADNTSFSQRYLSLRDGRTDEARFSVYASGQLPKDLREARLQIAKQGELNGLYATGKEELYTNSDGIFYRKWASDGAPVDFDDGLARVVFGHMFEETSGFNGEPVLLSHWVPDSGYARGLSNATQSRDRDDVFGVAGQMIGDGGQDIPTGYQYYQASSQWYGIGNKEDRPIDGYGLEKRMAYFESSGIRSLYQQSEGFTRDTVAVLDGREAYLDQMTEQDNRLLFDKARNSALERSLLSVYFEPVNGDKVAITRVDSYYVTDEQGEVLPWGKIGDSVFGFDGIHREQVFSSSFGKGNIDVIVGPSSYKQEDKEDVPFVLIGR